MGYEIEYATKALEAVERVGGLLPDETRKLITVALHVLRCQGVPMPEALAIELGGKPWVIARRTKGIVERYGKDVKCVSRREYEQATRRCLEALR